MRRCLFDLHAGSAVQAVHGGIFLKSFNASGGVVAVVGGKAAAVVLLSQSVAHFIEIHVAGMGDGARKSQRPVGAGIDPAYRGGILFVSNAGSDLCKASSAGETVPEGKHALFQTGRGGNDLEGGTGGRDLLGGIIQHGIGGVLGDLLEIVLIHSVGKQVVVIARIGYQGQDLAVPGICHNTGSSAGIQGQHGRGQLHALDPVDHEGIGGFSSVLKGLQLGLGQGYDALIQKKLADHPGIQCFVHDHVAVDLLGKARTGPGIFQDIIAEGLVDIAVGGGFRVQAGRIDPACGDRMGQKFRKGGRLVLGPAHIYAVGLIDIVSDQDTVVVEVGDQVVLVGLVFVRKIAVGSPGEFDLVLQTHDDAV